ncbi:hypothetical protein GCM10009624_07630 [Gordonia sinesedis]
MNRDLAIDATRGLAIWSMISLHFAAGTVIAVPTHSFPFVDGMSAFVLLSGLVLGLVYRRWIDRYSLGYAYRRLARRLVVLYVCQVAIALVAVAAALAGHRWLTLLLPVDGWGDGILQSLALHYLPSGGNILRLYLVLMASAFIVIPLLARGSWRFVLLASLALYALSQFAAPEWTYLTSAMESPRTENWAAWQVLFVPALVVGWNWQRWQVARLIDRLLPVLVVAAAGVWLAFHFLIVDGPLADREAVLADKVDLGPVRAIGAWLVVPTIYGIFRLLMRRRDVARVFRPLVMTGGRSLDSYVLQAIALVVVPIHVAHRPWDLGTTAAVVLLVFGACWGWAELRRAWGIDKLHRLPAILAERGRRAATTSTATATRGRGTGSATVTAAPAESPNATAAHDRVPRQPDSHAVPSPSLSRSGL